MVLVRMQREGEGGSVIEREIEAQRVRVTLEEREKVRKKERRREEGR